MNRKYEDITKIVDGIRYKECCVCLKWYPETLENFAKRSSNKGGLNTRCRDCQKVKDQSYYVKNREKMIKDSQEYYRQNKEWKQQYDKERQRGWGKEEYISRQKRYYKDNQDKSKERYKNFVKLNPDKVKSYRYDRMHKDHKITKQEWIECKSYFNNQCSYCGLPIVEHYNVYKGEIKLTDFHKEHVSHDGNNDLSNCVPSCKVCNSEKHTYILDEWYNPTNPKYTEERYNKIIKWITEDYNQIKF